MMMKNIAIVCALAFVLLGWSTRAQAYPWMIRHGYAACSMCHADPSGSGLLTAYGRAQGENLLRMQYGRSPDAEPGPEAGFLFGAVPLPDSLLLGGDGRWMLQRVMPAKGPSTNRQILMQADLEGQLTVDRFRGNVSAGYMHDGALGASVTRGAHDRMISRVHWVGIDLGEDKNWLLRAGRMNLPYGLRIIEHTMWVRTLTRTDINAAQQHGAALSYAGSNLRGEVMGIVGNFQVSPDAYRERGYSAFLEYAVQENLAVGASSSITHAARDVDLLTPLWRHAHGLFGRYAPVSWMTLLSEADLTLYSQPPSVNALGLVGMLQADFEPIQGLHAITTGELLDRKMGTDGLSYGAWGSIAWFFAPHADVRADAVWQSVATVGPRTSATTLLGQIHLYL
jgi:hypothetical protein